MLPELDALGALFEANEEWQQDAAAVRARMLGILSEVADRYVSLGEGNHLLIHHHLQRAQCVGVDLPKAQSAGACSCFV